MLLCNVWTGHRFWAGNRYHLWSVSATTMQARLQTSNWKQCVAPGWCKPAATTGSGRSLSRGVAAHCQILHLHLCPWHVRVRALQAVLVEKLRPFTTTSQSLTNAEEVLPMAVFALRLLNSRWSKKKKKWLLNWWRGSHNYFTSDQCCTLWTSVSVTGK